MKVINIAYDQIPDLPCTAAAIGYFDGFHLGHQKLLALTLKTAQEHDLESAVITFHPDPWTVFKPKENHDNLVSLTDKSAMAAAMGIDYLYVIDFSAGFAALPAEDFHQVLESLHVKYLVCGYDFTYGQMGLGNVETLREFKGLKTLVVDEITDLDVKVSSTRIEKLVRAGLMRKANKLLGYIYSLSGVIVKGYRRGSTLLAFPTANLQADPGYVIPSRGVYAGYVLYDGKFYKAMINIGTNPTFDNEGFSIEAHIFDFDKNIYGRMVRFFFAERLRPEIRFKSAEELRKQLKKDSQRANELLDSKSALFERTKDLWSLERRFVILEQ